MIFIVGKVNGIQCFIMMYFGIQRLGFCIGSRVAFVAMVSLEVISSAGICAGCSALSNKERSAAHLFQLVGKIHYTPVFFYD